MSRIQTLTLIVAGLLLCSAVAFAAGAPSNVSSVNAAYKDGKLTVSWSAATDDAGIAFYRVYFSRKSILDNKGDWEDFNRTKGPETIYVFDQPPYPGKTIYVSVLAVNTAGIESEGFEAEASADAPTDTPVMQPPAQVPPPAAVTPPPAQTPPQGEFTMDGVMPISSTGLTLTFNKAVSTSPAPTAGSFIVVDASGVLLTVRDVQVDGSTVTLKTDPQEPKKVYVVGLLQDMHAADGAVLASASPQIPFNGYATEAATPPPAPQQTESSSSSSAPTVVQTQPPPVGSVYGPHPGLQAPTQVYTPPTTVQNVPTSHNLNNSGVGMLAVMTVSGALAGRRIRRKKAAEQHV